MQKLHTHFAPTLPALHSICTSVVVRWITGVLWLDTPVIHPLFSPITMLAEEQSFALKLERLCFLVIVQFLPIKWQNLVIGINYMYPQKLNFNKVQFHVLIKCLTMFPSGPARHGRHGRHGYWQIARSFCSQYLSSQVPSAVSITIQSWTPTTSFGWPVAQ